MSATPLPSGWNILNQQDDIVDLNSVTGLYLYNVKKNSLITKLDYIDPNKGKILGTAQQDLDYISNFDPAKYNAGSSDILPIDDGYYWGEQHLGKIWWDLENVRYIDYEQDSLQYRISNWGKLFPGSVIEVYEWVSSTVLPIDYVSANLDGIPKYEDNRAYVEVAHVDEVTGVIKSKYYYWVRAKTTKLDPTKTHSVSTLENMISNPKTQGIPYAAILKDNSVSLYNIGEYLSDSDTALHIGYQTSLNQNIIHSEYELINENKTVPPRIIKKLLDSIIGADDKLNLVPDYNLSPGNKIGLGIRPRQTLIVNRLPMVEVIVKYLNSILIQYPVSIKIQSSLSNFYAMDPVPDSSLYDISVDSYAELRLIPPGQTVLVTSDSTHDGYWVIYTISNDNIPVVKLIQSFDVTKFWKFVDWYATGISRNTLVITYSIPVERDLYKFTFKSGDIVKILDNGTGLFEIYLYSSATSRTLIGLEQGTIELSSDLWKITGYDSTNFDMDYFDNNCYIEFRYILNGLLKDIYIDDLLDYYNKFLFVLIHCILAEQQTIDWAFKTSFLTIKKEFDIFIQPSSYIKDKSEYYIEYINEIKPYRTKVREYITGQTGLDEAKTEVTDFDLPAYYEEDLNVFRSPNGEYLTIDTAKFNQPKYVDWKNHHTYSLGSIELVSQGYGYSSPPDISIISTDGNGGGAKAYAKMNPLNGSILKIYVTDPGSGYTSTPLVVISGTGVTPVTVPVKYKVISRGYSDTTGTLASGLYDGETENLLYTASRSYTLHRIRIYDGSLEFSRTYDISGDIGQAAELTKDLNDTTHEYIVVVYSSDEPSINANNPALQQAMYRVGASEAIFGSLLKYRSSYIFVGRPNIGKNNGVEIYNGSIVNSTIAVCEFDFSIDRGQFIISRIVPEKIINDLSNDITDKNYAGLMDIPVSRWAQAVPILTNSKTRKLRTAIKFDRISYTSKVVDWTTGGFDSAPYSSEKFDRSYPTNTLVRYKGQGYINSVDAPGSGKFDFGIFELVDSGSFDNANDRIMACYQPTDGMPPRILSSVVSGIDIESDASSNGQVPDDTIISGGIFSSINGITSANIILSGGTFVQSLYSHSPEEHIPGSIFESLSIAVLSSTTGLLGYRMFMNTNNAISYTSINSVNITTLAEPLHITDSFITVTNGNTLPNPNAPELIPGRIYIQGERIEYYTKVGAVLGQLTRGCGGTSVGTIYHTGTIVEDVSLQQAIIEPPITSPYIY